jgi:3-hydroxyacyl-CoA dehydrogenase
VEAGRLGQKVGKGWYTYGENGREVDPLVTEMIEAYRREKGLVPRSPDSLTDEYIVQRLLYSLGPVPNSKPCSAR